MTASTTISKVLCIVFIAIWLFADCVDAELTNRTAESEDRAFSSEVMGLYKFLNIFVFF